MHAKPNYEIPIISESVVPFSIDSKGNLYLLYHKSPFFQFKFSVKESTAKIIVTTPPATNWMQQDLLKEKEFA